MATGVMNQAAAAVDLRWTQNDPISIAFIVVGEDWSGTYTAQVRDMETDALLATLAVTATFASGDTHFSLTCAARTTDPVGVAVWALKQTGSVTRMAGKAHIGRGPVHP